MDERDIIAQIVNMDKTKIDSWIADRINLLEKTAIEDREEISSISYTLRRQKGEKENTEVQGFIPSRTKLKKMQFDLAAFRMDDTSFYKSVIKLIQKAKPERIVKDGKINNNYIMNIIQYSIINYLGLHSSEAKRNELYNSKADIDDEPLSIRDFKQNGTAMCVERSAMAQNILAFLGYNPMMIFGYISNEKGNINEGHAYNCIIRDGKAMLIDFTNPIMKDNKYYKPAIYPIDNEKLEDFKKGKAQIEVTYKNLQTKGETIEEKPIQLVYSSEAIDEKYFDKKKAHSDTTLQTKAPNSEAQHESIKKIIDKANELKSKGISELTIAKFVHIELGKILIYDNNYTENYQKDGTLTQTSIKRRKKLLSKETNILEMAQICKGMAEIYVAILNMIGIKSKVVGAERKGEIDGATRADGTIIDVPEIYNCTFGNNLEILVGKNEKSNQHQSEHYYGIFEIDGQEYVQDFLIDRALFRIKTREATLENDEIPGLCRKEEYMPRTRQSLPLSYDYLSKFQAEYAEYTHQPSAEQAIQFLFEQLKKYNAIFGFEESKDFFLSMGKEIFPKDFDPKSLKYANLLKENQSTCDVISIYSYEGTQYLLRGGDKFTTINDAVGKISISQIEALLNQGYTLRKERDKQTLTEAVKHNMGDTVNQESGDDELEI